LIGLLGIAAYASLYFPHINEDFTEIFVSLSLGNVIRYFFDSENKYLPSTTLIIVAVTFMFSFLFLNAGFRIMKYVSSLNFNNGAALSAGIFSIRVDGLPKDLKNSKYVRNLYFL
jgi:hypothetical protein